MANKYYTGNTDPRFWSIASNWSGGTLPTNDGQDDVFANGRPNIIIDTNVNVRSINNIASGSTTNGNFTIDFRSGNISVTGGTIRSNGTLATVLIVNTISGQSVNIIGTIVGGTGGSSQHGIANYGNGIVNITGDISAGTVSNSYGLYNLSNGIININGNIFGSTNTSAHGVLNDSKGTINISGNTITNLSSAIVNNQSGVINYSGLPLSNSSSALNNINNARDGVVNIYGIQVLPQTISSQIYSNAAGQNGTINVYGNCYGGISGAASTYGLINNAGFGTVNIYGNVIASGRSVSSTSGFINNNANGVINVYGNVSGGTVLNSIAISGLISAFGTINIYGNVNGGSFTGNTPAIYSNVANTIFVSGNCIAGSYPAIFSSNISSSVIVGGLIFNNISSPYYAYSLKVTPTTKTISATTITNNSKILTTSGYTYGIPFSGNVRNGIKYGYMNEYTGSMILPSKHSVKIGTRFDTGNTYGEAIITTNDLNALFKSFSFTGI